MSRVLIVSHNPLSNSQSNGKTISSILSEFNKKDLAQLFFTLDTPDFDVCDNFYRITDVDILKNFMLLNKDVGGIIDKQFVKKNKFEKNNYQKNVVYNFIRKLFVSKISIMTTIRDFVWRNSDYYSKSFEKWLDDFNPDIVFFQSSNCCFAFEFVLRICRKRNIKVIIETTDDYLSYKKFNIFYNYNVYKLRRCYKKLNDWCVLILPISNQMKLYYKNMFPNNYYTVMNSVSLKNIDFKYNKDNPKILYAGNLGLGRWKVIYKLAKAIDNLKLNLSMEVYSIEPPSNKIIEKLNSFDCCRYCYSLNVDELDKKRREADILLHVESFSRANTHLTKYSISTKIPELMNYNRMILAVGPKGIASIEYLRETRTAFIINSMEKRYLESNLIDFLKMDNQNEFTSNCRKVVKENHDIKVVKKFIKQFVEEKI